MFKNTGSQKIALFVFDTTTGAAKTGDAANITAYVSKDFGTVTVLGDTSATEMDSTNAKGWYLFDLTQAETNADALLFTGKSSTANISVVGQLIYTQPANFSTLSVDSNGRVDVIKVAGTTQTARDIGASVIAASVTGLTASDVGAIKTKTDSLTFTVAGMVDSNVVDWKSATAPAMTGDAYARIGAAGAGLTALGDTRIANLDVAVSTRSSHAASDIWAVGTRLLTAGTNIQLPSNGLANVTAWTVALTGNITGNLSGSVGSVTGLTASNLDVAVSSRMATFSYTPPLDAAGTRSALGLASANLDTQIATLATSAALTAVQSHGDSTWSTADVSDLPTNAELATALAGADDAVLTQVALVKAKTDNLPSDPADQSLIIDATASILTAVGDVPTNAELATALSGADDAVLAAIASLTIPDAADNAAALLSAAYEGSESVQDFLRLSRAVLYGKANSLNGTTTHYRDATDAKNRVTATVDPDAGTRVPTALDAA